MKKGRGGSKEGDPIDLKELEKLHREDNMKNVHLEISNGVEGRAARPEGGGAAAGAEELGASVRNNNGSVGLAWGSGQI